MSQRTQAKRRRARRLAEMFRRALVNGSPLFDPRRLRPEQELAGAVLEGVVADLRHDPACARYTLAVAWVRGRFDCGCPYEADFDLERVAEVLNQDGEYLRRLLVSELRREFA